MGGDGRGWAEISWSGVMEWYGAGCRRTRSKPANIEVSNLNVKYWNEHDNAARAGTGECGS
jgi:hypothetical protein